MLSQVAEFPAFFGLDNIPLCVCVCACVCVCVCNTTSSLSTHSLMDTYIVFISWGCCELCCSEHESANISLRQYTPK